MLKLFFYDVFVLCFEFGAWLLSPFNIKSRLWLKGRINWSSRLKKKIAATNFTNGKGPVIWMHASSLGEFEQGRPLLESLKQQFPDARIIITFFSPSGYEVRKNYQGADIVTYLPTDTPSNAQQFLHLVKPTLVLWIKYEYWYHHLRALHKRNIPLLLVSATFFEAQAFFKWYGGLSRKMLRYFQHFFVQNEYAAGLLTDLLEAQNINATEKITVSGDTRFDRVIDIAENWHPIPGIERWINSQEQVVVAGSTWPADEEELVHFAKTNPQIKLIIAPHQTNPDTIKDTLETFQGGQIYSALQETSDTNLASNILIIDNVGMLSRLYKYATVCYVGGGFSGTGVHNVLEAAVYGKPVLHGPEYERYAEAIGLAKAGGSFTAESAIVLEAVLTHLLTDAVSNKKAADAARNFVYDQKGSTEKIIRYIQANRLVTIR